MGGCIIIPKTEDTLPENGGEVDLKTVSLGSATSVVKLCCPQGQTPQGKRERSSLLVYFPLTVLKPLNPDSCSTEP